MRARKPLPREVLAGLAQRPGFLIRRAHQIAAAAFLERVPGGLTPSQYGVLYALARRGPADQTAIARLVGLDKSTTGLVVARLARRGYVRKQPSRADRRRSVLSLAPKGKLALRRCEPRAAQTKHALLAVFSATERRTFLALLKKFVAANAHLAPSPTKT